MDKKINVNVATNVGQGIGCLLAAIALGVLLNFERILDIIELAVK